MSQNVVFHSIIQTLQKGTEGGLAPYIHLLWLHRGLCCCRHPQLSVESRTPAPPTAGARGTAGPWRAEENIAKPPAETVSWLQYPMTVNWCNGSFIIIFTVLLWHSEGKPA